MGSSGHAFLAHTKALSPPPAPATAAGARRRTRWRCAPASATGRAPADASASSSSSASAARRSSCSGSTAPRSAAVTRTRLLAVRDDGQGRHYAFGGCVPRALREPRDDRRDRRRGGGARRPRVASGAAGATAAAAAAARQRDAGAWYRVDADLGAPSAARLQLSGFTLVADPGAARVHRPRWEPPAAAPAPRARPAVGRDCGDLVVHLPEPEARIWLEPRARREPPPDAAGAAPAGGARDRVRRRGWRSAPASTSPAAASCSAGSLSAASGATPAAATSSRPAPSCDEPEAAGAVRPLPQLALALVGAPMSRPRTVRSRRLRDHRRPHARARHGGRSRRPSAGLRRLSLREGGPRRRSRPTRCSAARSSACSPTARRCTRRPLPNPAGQAPPAPTSWVRGAGGYAYFVCDSEVPGGGLLPPGGLAQQMVGLHPLLRWRRLGLGAGGLPEAAPTTRATPACADARRRPRPRRRPPAPPAPPPPDPRDPLPASGELGLQALIGRARAVSTRWGRRVTVRGTLANTSGAPLPNAQVCVSEQRAAGGAARTLTTVTTDAAGAFALTLEPGASRTLRFVHRVGAGAVSAAVTVRVRAPRCCTPRGRRIGAGRTVVLSGELTQAPRGRGLLVELQARRGRGFATFGTTRTDRGGGFRYRYRSRAGAGLELLAAGAHAGAARARLRSRRLARCACTRHRGLSWSRRRADHGKP